MNFLERLVAEWYEYDGYFVKTNYKFGKRPKGGFKGEFDVLAFHPTKKELVHIETSTDANSNNERKQYVAKKFAIRDDDYFRMFPFAEKWTIKRKAIIGMQNISMPNKKVEIISIPGFVKMVSDKLSKHKPRNDAVPECYPLVRAIQFAIHFRSR